MLMFPYKAGGWVWQNAYVIKIFDNRKKYAIVPENFLE